MALRQQQENLVRNRKFPFLPYFCLHSPIATNRITKPFVSLQQQQENFVRNRIFPFLLYICVHSPIATNRITKPFVTLRQQQENLVRNRTFPFLPCYCLHSPIATNRITKPFTALRQQQENFVRNRIFPFLPYFCLHSPIVTNCITKPNVAYSPANAKTADMISHVCRHIFINITLSNRIVKPNNRYTRQPASHDFPFYSASDKSYTLTATNRIAMRFIAHCHPPFRYPADNSDNSKGGT